MKKFKFVVSKKAYSNKEDAYNDVKGFRKWKDCSLVEGTFEDMVRFYAKGHTVCPAELIVGADHVNENVIIKHVAIVDIDNDAGQVLTIEEARSLAEENGLHVSAIYTSFSHSQDMPKFRMLFKLDTPITSAEVNEQLHKALFSVFTKNQANCADLGCYDFVRLFFGGKQLIYTNYNVSNTHEAILKAEKDTTGFMTKKMYTDLLKGKAPKKNVSKPTASPKSSPKVAKVIHPVIAMIQSRDVLGLREALSHIQTEVPTMEEDVFGWVGSLPLEKIFSVSSADLFRCILSDHNDSSPSAGIHHHTGKSKYKCFGCMSESVSYNFLDIVMHETNMSPYEALTFVADIFGLSLETEWQRNKKKQLEYSRKYVQSKEFQESYPDIYKELTQRGSKALHLYTQLTYMAGDLLSSEPISVYDMPVIYKSQEQIAIHCHMSLDGVKKHKKHFCLLGWLIPLKDEEIKEAIIKESKTLQQERQYQRRVDFIAIPPITKSLLASTQAILDERKQKSARKSFASYEQAKRTHGQEQADRAYVQENGRTSTKHDKFYTKYETIALALIDANGYTTEADILSALRGYAKKEKEQLSGECLPQLIQANNLTRTGLNKDLRNKYNVPSKVKANTRILFRA